MMTEQEALAKYDTRWWEKCDSRERTETQLMADRLIMPVQIFHDAIEKALGRAVYTHEFGDPQSLLKELWGDTPRATLADVMNRLPKDKRVIVAQV